MIPHYLKPDHHPYNHQYIFALRHLASNSHFHSNTPSSSPMPYTDVKSCSLQPHPSLHTSCPLPRPERKSHPSRNEQVPSVERYDLRYDLRIGLVLDLDLASRRMYIVPLLRCSGSLVIECLGLYISPCTSVFAITIMDDSPSCPRFSMNCFIDGPGNPFNASKHNAVSSVTHALPSCSAAALHLAIATSCVVPCTSGTSLSAQRHKCSVVDAHHRQPRR